MTISSTGKGVDVVVTKADNNFVTILENVIKNGWFDDAIPIP
jgi:hypothetical protein